MSAYRTAARMLQGSHLPPLCVGMELVRVHNLNLASQFIFEAKDICESDPLVWNEIAVIEFKMKRYAELLTGLTVISRLRSQIRASGDLLPIGDHPVWTQCVSVHCLLAQHSLQHNRNITYTHTALRATPGRTHASPQT